MWAVWATFLASFLPSSSAAAAWCSDGGDNCTCAQGSALPQYHITGLSGGAHDVNAILRWQGLTHVFHQRDGGWGHLVSADMQRWRRLPDALTDGAWDGGLAIIPDADGQPTPTILFDCTSVANCRPPGADGQPNASAHPTPLGDPAIIGLARPENTSDPELKTWAKSSDNPISFGGAPATFSGPSAVWRVGGAAASGTATQKYQMEMILGQSTGLFETTDTTLRSWTLKNPQFFPRRGGGGGLFLPLPRAGQDAPQAADAPTHMLQTDFAGGKDGRAWFTVGRYDALAGRFTPTNTTGTSTPLALPLDVSDQLAFTTLAYMPAPDGRLLHMGWVTGAHSLSVARHVTFDDGSAADAVPPALLAQPVSELAQLRGAVLGAHAGTAVSKDSPLTIFDSKSNSGAFDLDMSFELPQGTPMLAQVSVFAAGPNPSTDMTRVLLQLNVSAPVANAHGARDVAVMHCETPACSWSKARARHAFRLPGKAVETGALQLRVLGDRTIAEVFVGEGRAVLTATFGGAGAERGAYVLAVPGVEGAVTVRNATAWEMGCGWDGGSPRPPTPPPTPTPTPAPPHPAVWHLPTRCEEGDVNALFQFNGAWHVMSQWHARPATSVGHAVSNDLLHWRRLPDVLASGPTGDEQCYDGSASIVTRAGGFVSPMLMIDGGCGMKGPGGAPCMESSGNGSTGGVTAFPANLSDPDLVAWTRSGPTVFEGCDGSAGPSPIIVNPVTGVSQLIAIHGHGEALFEATSDTLTAWKMVEPAFLPQRGGGGGLWHPLPKTVDAAHPAAVPWATHIMQLDGANGDGGADFALMRVDAATSKVLNLTQTVPLEQSHGPKYGQLSTSGGTARGGGPGDGRTIHVSWLTTAALSGSCSAPNVDVGQLTCFRDMQYDPRVGPFGALVELPITEYLELRGSVLDAATKQTLAPAPAQLLALGAGATAADIELNVTALVEGTLTIGVACGGVGGQCGASLSLALGTPSADTGGRNVTMAVTGGRAATFPLLTGETVLPVRIMTDVGSVEIFAGYGRGIFSGGLQYGACTTTKCLVTVAFAASDTPMVYDAPAIAATAWEMRGISVLG